MGIGLDDIHRMIQDEADDAGGLRALGRKWKLSAAYLSDILRHRRNPGPSVLSRFGLVALRTVTTEYLEKKNIR